MEKKTILTFLSQGAVAGVVGLFLLFVITAVSHPNGYSSFYLGALPMILGYGSVLGAITAVFVWLPGVLLRRRLRVVARVVIGMAAAPLVVTALAYLREEPEIHWTFSGLIHWICAIGLPVGLIAGSRISPWRMIVIGSGVRSARRNFGSWLSFPVGFLLRVASVFCLLEALLTLAVWIACRRMNVFGFPARGDLPAIVLAALYFAASAYFGFRSPRKFFLLTIAILLNLPLAIWIGSQRRADTVPTHFLLPIWLGFIFLWAVYTLGRMIAPESASSMVHSLNNSKVQA